MINNKLRKIYFIIFIFLTITKVSFSQSSLNIERTIPTQLSKNVKTNIKISIYFNKPVIETDINRFTYIVNDGISDVSGVITYNEKEMRADFLPDTIFKSGHEYYVKLEKGIRAKDNTSLVETVKFSFYTKKEGNFSQVFKKSMDFYSSKGFNMRSKKVKVYKPLKMLRNFPEDLTKDNSEKTIIWAEFSTDLNSKTVNNYTMILKHGTKNIKGVVSYNAKKRRTEFKPLKPLEKGKVYRVILSSYISDREDNFLNSPIEWVFKTKGVPPKIYLDIIDSSPVKYQHNVNPMSKINIKFNRDIVLKTLNRFTVSLKNDKENIFCDIKYNSKAKLLVITPEKYLKSGTWYEIILRKGIRSKDGAEFKNGNIILKFRTADKINLYQDIVKEKLKKEEKLAKNEEQKKLEKLNRIKKMRKLKEEKKKKEEQEKLLIAKNLKIVKAYPHIDQKAVKVNSEYLIEFNNQLYSRTVNQFTVIVSDGYDTVCADVSYDSAHNRIIYKSRQPLKYATKYYIQLSSHIKSLNNVNLDKVYKWWFETEEPPDTTPPAIISLWPKKNEIKVEKQPEIKVVFNEEIQPMSLNMFTFYLTNGHKRIKAALSYSRKYRTAYLKPEKILEEGYWYNIYLTNGILDLSGNKLATPKNIRFLVGLPPDNAPPLVNRISPGKDAMIETINPIISVSFNEPVKSSTITPYTFFITQNGQTIPSKLSYNRMTNTALCSLLNDLEYEKTYKITLTKGIEDLSGNKTILATKWLFTTYDPKKDLPYISSSYPSNNETKIPLETKIMVVFNREINPVSLNKFTVKLYKNNKNVDGTIEYNKEKKALYFVSKKILTANSKYEFIINKGIQDTRGVNLKKDHKVVFYTE